MRRLAVVVGLSLAVGCGEAAPEQRPATKAELRALLRDVELEIGVAFHRVDEVAHHGDAEQLRVALARAAETEDRQAQRLGEVIPPREVRRPVDRLVSATREQAKNIARLARREDLNAELLGRDSLREDRSDREIDEALEELEARGYSPTPTP